MKPEEKRLFADARVVTIYGRRVVDNRRARVTIATGDRSACAPAIQPESPDSETTIMANKDQSKGKAKSNQPKLTAKQKKEKKLKKQASKREA
jgi:hypothetical protein